LDIAVLEETGVMEDEDEDFMTSYEGGGAGGTTRFLQIAGRRLSIGSTSLTVVKGIVIVIGAILAVCIHLMKMIIRLFGEGCCTGCIAMVEVAFVTTTVLISIYIQQVAIVIALGLLCVAGYILKRKCIDKKQPDGPPAAATAAGAGGATTLGYGATTTTNNVNPGNVTTTITTTTAPDGSIITTTYTTTTTTAPAALPAAATAGNAAANPTVLLPVADIEQPTTIATLVMEIPASAPEQHQQHPPPSAPMESPQK
jgi:hypothetical protein